MDPGNGSPARAGNAVDTVIVDMTTSSLPSTREGCRSRQYCQYSCCGRWRLSWSAVSVVEIALMLLTVVFYFFFAQFALKQMLPADTNKDGEVTPLSEWVLRMFGSMVCVQIVLLITGIRWGDTITRKIIYCGMLTGYILLVTIQAAFVQNMSERNAVNIAIVFMASALGLFRVITLIFNPGWWRWE